MKEFQYITWQPVDFPPTTPKNTQDAFRNYSGYTNIPSNRTSHTQSNTNTPQPKQTQRTASFTESSSSDPNDDGVVYMGEKRLYNPTSGHPQPPAKVSKVNSDSRPYTANFQSEQSYFPSQQVWTWHPPLDPLPTPLQIDITHSFQPQQIQQKITVTSPDKKSIVTVNINSSIKLPDDQKPIKACGKQSADQINNSISNSKAITPFVDPTYDAAFKYLFSQSEFAQSFIASLLELKYNITSLKPINVHLSELQQGNQSNENQASLAVDGLFKVKTDDPQNNKMLVFLEMQRKPFPGFLTREQIYSALIATNAVKKGVSKNYDKIPQVVGIIIALKNILPKEAPYCSQISTTIQSKDGNLINVKFSSLTDLRIFELEKFLHHPDCLNVNKYSSYTLQWLNFLLKCREIQSIPDNTSDIITKAYNHMKRENMTQQDLALIDASRIKAELEEQARNHELIVAEQKGERAGEIKSAVKNILKLTSRKKSDEEIKEFVDELNHQEIDRILKHIKASQAQGNTKLTPQDIIKKLGLLNEHTSLVDTKVEEESTVNLELQESQMVVNLELNLSENNPGQVKINNTPPAIDTQFSFSDNNNSSTEGLLGNDAQGEQENHNPD